MQAETLIVAFSIKDKRGIPTTWTGFVAADLRLTPMSANDGLLFEVNESSFSKTAFGNFVKLRIDKYDFEQMLQKVAYLDQKKIYLSLLNSSKQFAAVIGQADVYLP
jgi:hypothetical protein